MLSSFAVVLALCAGCARPGRRMGDMAFENARPDLDAARELDQQGVQSFRNGRYVDAIAFFQAARERGGPSSELWNIARCQERLDRGREAVSTLLQYLVQGDLPAADRAEAEHEAKTLRSRLSALTVITSPPGAAIKIDGQTVLGTTPLSLEISPGSHSLGLTRAGYEARSVPLDAGFGRAIIVSLSLARLDH